MAIERGGLDYTIEVRDKFLAQTRSFQDEIAKSEAALASFEKRFASFTQTTRRAGFRDIPEQTRRTRTEFEKAEAAQRQFNRSFALSAQDRARRLQELAVQTRNTQANFRSEEAALRRIIKAERELTTQQRLRARGRTTTGLTQQEAVQQQALLQIEREKIRLQARQRADQSSELAQLRQEEAIRRRIQQRTVQATSRQAALLDTELQKLEAKNRLLAEERSVERRLEGLKSSRLQSLRLELDIKRKIAAADQKAAVSAALAAQGRGPTGERIKTTRQLADERLARTIRGLETDLEFKSLEKGNKRLKQLRAELGQTENRANRVAFTFRRLFGILAAFAAARFAIQGFRDLVSQTIQFNAQIEQAELGVAALLTAVGRVSNATGEAGTAAQQLALAQAEARRQTALLRVDAQRTAATFQQLLETFQVAIAPGLTAGLDVDEIRRLTVQIAQAAAAIGVPQNQLAEEIRSLLAGTIQARTTRIATALGITNEDIRLAREAGILADFLNERFEAFSEAGEEALGTFNALLTNVRDSIGRLLGAGGIEFFEQIKGLLEDVLNSLQETSDEGFLEPNPRAIAFVQTLFRFLTAAVQEARNLVASLSFEDLQDTISVISNVLTGIIRALGGAIRGIVLGLGDAGRIINQGVVEPLRAVLGIFGIEFQTVGDTISDIVAFVTRWVTLFFALKTTLIAIVALFTGLRASVLVIVGIFRTLVGLSKTLLTTVTSIRGVSLATLGPILAIVAAVVAIGFALQKSLSSLFGIELKFKSLVTIISVNVVGALQILASKVEFFFTTAFSKVRQVIVQIGSFIEQNILAGIELVLRAADAVLGVGADALKRIEQSRKVAAQASAEALKSEKERLNILQLEIKDREEQLRQATIRATTDALADNETAETFGELMKKGINSALEAIGLEGLFEDVDLGLGDDTEEAEKLSEVFANLPSNIEASSNVLNRQTDIIAKLRGEVEQTSLALSLSAADLGVSGGIQRQARIFSEAQLQATKETKEITTTLTTLEERRASIRDKELQVGEKVLELRRNELAVVQEGIVAGLQLARNQNLLARTESTISRLRLESKAAQENADEEALSAARQRLQQELQVKESLLSSIEALKEQADALTTGLDPEARSRVVDLIRQALVLNGQEKGNEAEINRLLEGRQNIESQILEVARNRLIQVAQAETFQLRQQTIELENQAAAQQRLAAVRAAQPTEFGFRVADAENLVDLERTRLTLLAAQADRDEQSLQRRLLQVQGTEAEKVVLEEIAALHDRNNLSLTIQNQKLKEAEQQYENIKQIAEAPVRFGIAAAFKDFTDLIVNKFDSALELAAASLNAFASFVTETITAAFDPNEEGTTRERFNQFFQGLFKLFVGFLTKLAIAYLAITLIPGLKEFIQLLGNVENATGRAEGGPIPKTAAASPAHYINPQGFSKGGRPKPPPGISKKDTTPIWAEPGEWVIPVKIVRDVGERFFRGLIAGDFDPGVLQGLATGTKISRHLRAPKVPSFQFGGPVPASLSESQSASSLGSGRSLSANRLLIADEETASRLSAGGRTGWLRFFNEEDEVLRAGIKGNPGQ